jgi:hypothetical protein
MYSRKIALSLSKQYRRCPPPRIMEDPSQRKAWKNHRAVCPYCSSKNIENRTAWDALAQEMERMHPSVEKPKLDDGRPVHPGQFCFVRPDAGVWRENYFYTPPMVFIIKRISSIPGAILAAQTYHDIQMAAPGDLIVTADDSVLGPLFVECWNTYTLKETLLGPPLDTVPERVMDAVLEYENQPGFCPEWAMLPRPLAENDPRIFFRELELEVAYTFSSQSVSQIMEAFEVPALKQLCSSPARLQEMIRTAVPGTHWRKLPLSPEEACAMAELPVERLPLAAEDQITHKTTANLIRMEADRVKSVTPIAMELYGRSGELTLSGRIYGLPEDFDHSRFICFLEPEGRTPVSPARCEWKEETGDFIIDFSYMEDITWRLKAAVVIETA